MVVIINIVITLLKKTSFNIKPQLKEVETSILKFESNLEKNEKSLRDELQRNRSETNNRFKENREELANSLNLFSDQSSKNIKEVNELLKEKFELLSKQQMNINKQTIENIKDIKISIETQLKNIREDNTKQLDKIEKTVDEKLQKTLNDRLSQSFETVSKQLQAVQLGLGEMKTLASDVGGLKKVLSNVKMRGNIGELQLEMLLEEILAPNQYEANVKTNKNSSDLVEFAIKLPGKDELKTHIWLPIDAKFPKDIYEQLLDSYDEGNLEKIKTAQKTMETTIKRMAKDISSKYISPPETTDFGIMFLPFEGIYAEVVRSSTLLETLQRDYKIIVTGPSTLAAILNSLQIGFRTLAIEKRSSEVWKVLSSVKKEFETFSGLMEKAKKNIQTGLNQLDDVTGKRTRAIQRKLKDVEILDNVEDKKSIDF